MDPTVFWSFKQPNSNLKSTEVELGYVGNEDQFLERLCQQYANEFYQFSIKPENVKKYLKCK